MKKIYSITITLLFAVSLFGQINIYPPNLRAPSNGEGNMSPNVTLDWDAVTGQTTNITYEVQIATQPDFADAVTFERTDLTALDMSELFFGKVYYWHVKAYDDEEPSGWSETWSFSIITIIDITKPEVAKDIYTTETVEWAEITGLVKYELQTDTVYEWKSNDTVTDEDILGSYVIDANNMWLVGENGLIIHFDGTEWIEMDAGTDEDIYAITIIDATNAYAVGSGGVVLNYNGTDWAPIDVGTPNDLTGVSFIDADNGWIVGDTGIVIKYASGVWSQESSGTADKLTGVFALNASDVWACGEGKIVAHYNGSDWTSEQLGSKNHYAITFEDENNGWVVGQSGRIYYYNGSEWIQQESGTGKHLLAVSFSGMMGYAVGQSGTMVSFNGDWREVASESDEELKTVSVNGDVGLTAGKSGTVVVKSAEGFSSPYLHTYAIDPDSTNLELTNLLFGKTIYYRMRAIHSLDTSYWTGGRSMNTFPAPVLDKPTNGSSGTDLMLLFEWDEYEGATDYTFQISFTEDFADPIVSFSDSNSTNYSLRFFGQDYYWRVNALHPEDISDWSDIWSLTTTNTVDLTTPENEEEDVTSCPKYEWEEIVGVANYEIWVDSDSDFSDPTKNVTEEPTYQCASPLDKNGIYYWKVRASTSLDTTDWSPVYSFKVEGYAGIEDEFTSGAVDIYPNPTSGVFDLTINSFVNDVYNVTITDITGKLIYQQEIECKSGENNLSLNLTGQQNGIYLVNIRKHDKTVTKKLFVR